MIVVGLTGSIAMGKSEVAKVFRTHGIPVFDADAEVHNLYDSEQGTSLLQHLAPEATSNGKVDRNALSSLVLRDPKILEQVEKLVHAEIARRRASFIESERARNTPFIVLDIPLLFEKGMNTDVSRTIVVSSPASQQRARALARPGMTEKKLDMIMTRQMPDSEKRKRATYIIENDGSLKDLERRTEQLIRQIRKENAL
jgi:dephospho-CoA kinase